MLNRLQEALEARKTETIENWVHDFLNQEGNNQGFSEGLKRFKRYWLGPVLMDLRKIKRCCGPEPEMVYHEPEENFNRRIDGIMKAIENGKEMPPLIVKYENGVYELNDGNHRHEALLRMNQPYYYVILWDSDNHLEKTHGYLKWINEHFGDVVVKDFDEGHMKKCYVFSKDQQKYLVSISEKSHGLLENKWLLEKLQKNHIPVKTVYKHGYYGDKTIEVTSFIEGEAHRESFKEKISLMKKLHDIPCHESHGYGWIDEKGNGMYPTAAAFIQDFLLSEEKGYWKDFYKLFDQGLDRNLYFMACHKILEHLKYSEDYRHIVHGDLHQKHFLFQNKAIKGLIDWDKAMYFDKLYDWFYIKHSNEISPYKDEPHYETRMMNMQLIYLVDALRFYFKNHQQQNYLEVKKELENLLDKL